jgi:hypothetical protein
MNHLPSLNAQRACALFSFSYFQACLHSIPEDQKQAFQRRQDHDTFFTQIYGQRRLTTLIRRDSLIFLNQPSRSTLLWDKMNVTISQQATENERSSRVSGI